MQKKQQTKQNANTTRTTAKQNKTRERNINNETQNKAHKQEQ